MRSHKLTIALGAAALTAAFAPVAHADTIVCNEAENSCHGGYVVTDGPVDPIRPRSCAARRCGSATGTASGQRGRALARPAPLRARGRGRRWRRRRGLLTEIA